MNIEIIKDKTSRKHYSKYNQFYKSNPEAFNRIALNILRQLCHEGQPNPVEYLRHAYLYDRNLNNTFRSQYSNYDCWFKKIQSLTRSLRAKDSWSKADSICLIKHAMIYGLLECEPEFTDTDIKEIPTETLEKDLQDSRDDISVCDLALRLGQTTYSGGSVEQRKHDNEHFVKVITEELERRRNAS